MTQPIKLSELLRDSGYKLTQFKAAQIQALKVRITMKDTGKAFVKYRQQGGKANDVIAYFSSAHMPPFSAARC
jgi:hypothetical protein